MDGILIVDKPAGMTSHDVVARIRRALGERRVGHAGTLDPDATGVLVIGVGRATRLLRFIEVHDKEYVAEATFGVTTSTQDASGEQIAEADASMLTLGDVEREAAAMVGETAQVPPMVSAVKVGGERLYRKARRGEDVERASRPITVHSMTVERFVPGERARAGLRVVCSRGTYVRTLVHDLGCALGVGAHVSQLRRVRVGPFGEESAVPVAAASADLLRLMIDAVVGYPVRAVDASEAAAIAHGKPIPAFGRNGPYAIVGPDGLVAMSEDRGSVSRPICVVAEGRA